MTGNEIGPFQSLELSSLASVALEKHRTRIFPYVL